MPENIVLVGFMGVGKGQVARALAIHTSMYALDCDDLIESMTNQKIKKIFAQQGEDEFRKLERITAQWLRSHVRNTIISTGGGFVNVPSLHEIGTVVYLHAPFEYIIDKIKAHPNAHKKIKKRPLLKDLDKAKDLYATRLPLYRGAADIEINMQNKEISEAIQEITDRLRIDGK